VLLLHWKQIFGDTTNKSQYQICRSAKILAISRWNRLLELISSFVGSMLLLPPTEDTPTWWDAQRLQNQWTTQAKLHKPIQPGYVGDQNHKNQ
jgi:hypothetical protein